MLKEEMTGTDPWSICAEIHDALSDKFNNTHRHLALDKLKVIYGEQKTVGLFSICDTLDTRYTASQVSDENCYNISKISTISAIF